MVTLSEYAHHKIDCVCVSRSTEITDTSCNGLVTPELTGDDFLVI